MAQPKRQRAASADADRVPNPENEVTIIRAPMPPAWRVEAALDLLLDLLDNQPPETETKA